MRLSNTAAPMEQALSSLFAAMISYMEKDAGRIQHFTKVHAYSRLIGSLEQLDPHTLFILEAAALLHDIGIRDGERLYGRCDGKIQEEIGPAEAEKLLSRLNFLPADIERICYLIGHHHTYHSIDGIDYQILIEADFLVNLQEENCSEEECKNVYKNIFKTENGKKIMKNMFGI